MEKSKTLLELIIMPLTLAIVGVSGTYFVTKMQTESANIQGSASIESAAKTAKTDQEIKILELFFGKITSKDRKERELAVRLLSTVDSVLATKLATYISSDETEEPSIRAAADSVISLQKILKIMHDSKMTPIRNLRG